jgi:glycerate kinase
VKIICAPDSFKDCLTAARVAAAMQRGIFRVLPNAQVDCCPVADGGEGTAAVIAAAIGAEARSVSVSGPLGYPVAASFFFAKQQQLAIMDMASAAGLMLVPAAQRDVMHASTYGVGELLLAAVRSGARRIIVGVGGSAGNDGGCGMAQALGVQFLDPDGQPVHCPVGGADLLSVSGIDASLTDAAIRRVDIRVSCDVENPLTGLKGAARVYAAQKGATAAQIERLERGLLNLAALVHRDLGIDLTGLPRCGAAGGLAAGLLAFAGARLESGIDTVLEAVDFAKRVKDCALCLTGEGRLDEQSLSGKACLGVARYAERAGVPTVALVGSIGDGADRAVQAGLSSFELIGEGLPETESIRRAEDLVADAAARVTARMFRQTP